jgi:hypothetical protein
MSNVAYTDASNNFTCLNTFQAIDISGNLNINGGNINTNSGTITASTFTSTSDARDKKDIVPLKSGLPFITSLNPVSFTWDTRNGSIVDKPAHGFIAQELQQIQMDTGISVPDLVYDVDPENLKVSYQSILPLMVKSIQELKQEIDELKRCFSSISKL